MNKTTEKDIEDALASLLEKASEGEVLQDETDRYVDSHVLQFTHTRSTTAGKGITLRLKDGEVFTIHIRRRV